MKYYSSKQINNKAADAYEEGISLQRSGQYNAAIKALREAVTIDPSFVEAYNSLGLTYKKAGDFDSAIEVYNQGIEALFQNIYDEIKSSPVRDHNDRYTSTKSETWTQVASQIATKNCAKDGIKTALFPSGDDAVRMMKENPVAGLAFKDVGDIRYFLPAYFSAFYEALKSELLYSIIVNNVGSVFAEMKDQDQALKCFKESIEFIPYGTQYDDPYIGVKEIESKGKDHPTDMICRHCGEHAPYFGLRGYCLKCRTPFDNERKKEQMSVALNKLYSFIDDHDESLGPEKNAVLNALHMYKEKIDKTGKMLDKNDTNSLKELLRDLGQIGGNKIGGAIKIPKEGKFSIILREEGGMVSSGAAELLSLILLAVMFITNQYE